MNIETARMLEKGDRIIDNSGYEGVIDSLNDTAVMIRWDVNPKKVYSVMFSNIEYFDNIYLAKEEEIIRQIKLKAGDRLIRIGKQYMDDFRLGYGDQNYALAKQYIQKAADMGHPEAELMICQWTHDDIEEEPDDDDDECGCDCDACVSGNCENCSNEGCDNPNCCFSSRKRVIAWDAQRVPVLHGFYSVPCQARFRQKSVKPEPEPEPLKHGVLIGVLIGFLVLLMGVFGIMSRLFGAVGDLVLSAEEREWRMEEDENKRREGNRRVRIRETADSLAESEKKVAVQEFLVASGQDRLGDLAKAKEDAAYRRAQYRKAKA